MATMEAPPRLQVNLHEGAFKNEPFVDFSREDNARKMRAAIEKVRGPFPILAGQEPVRLRHRPAATAGGLGMELR